MPEMTGHEFKEMLRPVLDFESKSREEAYLETVPPKAKEAIQNHQVLVGMNREMVTYAKGRPPKKVREREDETEYEEWIYGEPPQDVEFVRFIGDEVVQLEIMKVDGTKTVRIEKEIDLESVTKVAKDEETARPPNAPTLRRAGEETGRAFAGRPGTAPRDNRPQNVPDPGTTSSPNFRPYLVQNLASPAPGFKLEAVKIALGQINPTVGDFSGNANKIIDFAATGTSRRRGTDFVSGTLGVRLSASRPGGAAYFCRQEPGVSRPDCRGNQRH